MLRTAIVEDNASDAQKIYDILMRYTDEAGLRFHVDIYQDPLDFLQNYKAQYELIFMDIELPNITGMEAARRLREIDSLVTLIFVTNMAQYALNGYEVDALDFVLKPVRYDPFVMKLKKAVRNVKRVTHKELYLNAVGGYKRLLISQILYIEVQKHYLTYHTEEGEFTVRGTMKAAEEKLLDENFVRCSNSYLVNLRHVTMVQKNFVEVGADLLPISRSLKADFLKKLTSYLGGSI